MPAQWILFFVSKFLGNLKVTLFVSSALFFLVSCSSTPPLDGSDDPFLWLEEVEGPKALGWVKSENKKTLDKLKKTKGFPKMKSEALSLLESKDKIPYVRISGAYLYNFWQDAKHVRGLWRRTTLKSFETKNPKWDVLIDLDGLAKKEKENWVFKGSDCLAPDYDLCLINLSRGGKDATVVREFQISKRAFVKNGFQLKEAKSDVAWIDKDQLFVGTDFGNGSLTESGYPRIVKVWKRGTPLSAAKEVYSVDIKDMGAYGRALRHNGAVVGLLEKRIGFYSSESWIYDKGKKTKVPKPDSAEILSLFKGHLLIQLRDPWTRGGVTFPRGSVVGLKVSRLLSGKSNSGDLISVYHPLKGEAVLRVARTRDTVLVNTLENVRGRVLILGLDNGKFVQKEKPLKNQGHITLAAADSDGTYFFFNSQGFLNPSSLSTFNLVTHRAKQLKTLPAKFDSKGMVVEQRWAESLDGTKVPYFLVGLKTAMKTGKAPTLLYGYGGFEVSRTPSYSSVNGKLWLEQGGLYALANIRGGGEFGPKWHQAALKKNRHKAYDDFIAVGEHLVASKVTSREHLAIFGGSNGGLLVGAVMTRRPDLFKAVICMVPLLDMLRYSQLLAGASWMAEYGDPRDKSMRRYLASYSPYHNVRADVDYPSLLFMTSTKDDRVHPGHARKMAAKMKSQGHKDLLYYENMEGGHAASANLEQKAEMTALRYAFLKETL